MEGDAEPPRLARGRPTRRDRFRQRQLRPPVQRLPDEVRGPQREGEQARSPEPRITQRPPRARHHQADEEAEQQEGHEHLVLQPDARGEPDEEPPRPARGQRPHREPGDHRPREQVERGGREQVAGLQHHRRDRDAAGRQGLGAPTAAELAGQQGGDHHEQAHEQGGQYPQPHEGVPGQRRGQPRERRRERALVHIAPGRLPGGGEEVELVPVVAVAPGRDQQDRDEQRRDRRDGARCERWARRCVLGRTR